MKISLFGCACALLLATMPAIAQDQPSTTGAAAETANRIVNKNGIGLTPDQAKLIVQSVDGQKEQNLPPNTPAEIGVQVPDSLTLMEMPVEVKDKIGSLRDFKSAKLQNDRIVLVDPTSRVIVDVLPGTPR